MIETYDNLLTATESSNLFNLIMNSNFKIGWEDSDELQHRAFPNIHAEYNLLDIQKTKLLEPVLDKLKDKNIGINNYNNKCIVNLTKPMDVNFIHVHPKQVVALHYSNITWNPEWGGETVFYKDNKKDILFSSPYTPNRLIIFDGEIPHTIKSQNILGTSYRFTTSIFFDKK